MLNKLTFSGHETFHCRPLWLFKGYNFLKESHKFTDADSMVKLGVGKNMVSSISFWMRAFNISTLDHQLTEFGHNLLGNFGRDKYFEKEGTFWLLHYNLVTRGFASVYSLFFNSFRPGKSEFSKEQFLMFLRRVIHDRGLTITNSTIEKDIQVFLRTYVNRNSATKNLEDHFSGLLYDLDLIDEKQRKTVDGKTIYTTLDKDRESLPLEVFLFALLDFIKDGNVVNVETLIHAENSPGRVFCMTTKGILQKIDELTNRYPDQIIFSDDAGIKQIQFSEKKDKWTILDEYYDFTLSAVN